MSGGENRTLGVAEVVRKLGTSRRIVALTFDAGYEAGYTSQILDTLEANGVKASFGTTGKWAKDNPELLKRIVDEGHMIINHSYSHSSFTGFSTNTTPLSREERVVEVRKTESVIQEVAGVDTKPYFRPPYGDYNEQVIRAVYALGYRYTVMWSVDTRGWSGATKRQILRQVLDNLEPGAIYLFHVAAMQDSRALPAVISALRERGYSFATIDDFYP
jgi:delta-lactam-biosynthetic de-N-acetylase